MPRLRRWSLGPSRVTFAATRFIIGLGGSLLAPGFGQALAGRTKRAVLWLVAIAVALVAVALSVWTLPVLILVRIASVPDAGIVLRAERTRPRAHWGAAVIVFVLSFPLGFIVRAYMLEAFNIPSSSQYPTLPDATSSPRAICSASATTGPTPTTRATGGRFRPPM
jgi:hypothetical protein